jgi:glycine/D-amino acid oxidase-like deaminating enzyme
MEQREQGYDVVVLGAGRVGQNAADRAWAAGLRVAVVERELVGGECSYWACVPNREPCRDFTAIGGLGVGGLVHGLRPCRRDSAQDVSGR